MGKKIFGSISHGKEKRIMKKLAVLLLCLAMVPSAFAADLDAAKKEGKANFYANITAVEPIMEAFAAAKGVKGVYTRVSTAKYVATVLTEHGAGKLEADVLQGPLPILEALKEKGVLAPYRSPSAAGYPEWARNDDTIMQFGIEYVALIYNKDLVKPADVPKSYKELTDPKWRDKIVMPDPATHATTISWLVGLKEARVFASEDEWMNFLKGLAANKPMFVASFSPTPAPVESGPKLIAVRCPSTSSPMRPPRSTGRGRKCCWGPPAAIANRGEGAAPERGRGSRWLTGSRRTAMQLSRTSSANTS